MKDLEEEASQRRLKAENFWSSYQTAAPLPVYWKNPYVEEIAFEKSDGKWYLEYIRDKYFHGRPAEHALSIGCGAGENDRRAFDRSIFSRLTGVDFSTGGLEVARREAALVGMPANYVRKDFNSDLLPGDEKYDLVFDYASSHHVANLEHLMEEIERVLSPEGYFVLYGYCGPARFQWPPKVMTLVNDLLSRMPMSLRHLMPSLTRPSHWEIISTDPSEAVRGSEVVDVVRSIFDVVEEIDLGYTLSHPMFAQNAYALDPSSDGDQALFRLICRYEKILIDHGVIAADVKVMVCKRRPHEQFRPTA